MPTFESPSLVELFTTYTAGPTSIAAHLGDAATARAAGDPLIVATGSDLALYPGNGEPPSIEPFRLSTRGFKELAAVSHLGPALATLARLRETGAPWEADATRLLEACKTARAANNVALWRDHIAVPAFAGRERAIAAMVDYSCQLSERRLARALDDPGSLTVEALRADYLEGPADELPVPFNRIMIATFFLTGLDVSHRFLTWFDRLDLGWERAMVIVAGQAGRPTAGVTEESNSVAGMIRAAGRGRLPQDRLFIAPHAPVFSMYDGSSTDVAASLEPQYRRLWAVLHATSQLGGQMFTDRPRFVPRTDERVRIDAGTQSVHEKPAIDSPDDWFALITRLRVVMEDPRQLLSGAVTDYAARQLVDNHNDPSAVTVPGLDGEPFPLLNEESFHE
jgi:hypothetical protein